MALQNVTELAYLIHSDERLSASCFLYVIRTGSSNCLQCASAYPWLWPCLGGAQPDRDPLLPTCMTPFSLRHLGPLGSLQCVCGRLITREVTMGTLAMNWATSSRRTRLYCHWGSTLERTVLTRSIGSHGKGASGDSLGGQGEGCLQAVTQRVW